MDNRAELVKATLRAETDLRRYPEDFLEVLFEVIFGSENMGHHLLHDKYLPERNLFHLFCALDGRNTELFVRYLDMKEGAERTANNLYYQRKRHSA